MSNQKNSLKEQMWPSAKTEKERSIASSRFLAGAMTVSLVAAGMGILKGDDFRRDKDSSPIERVADVDTKNLDELDLEKGTIVYNDTEDTYMVYVDDTEVSPAQEPGWYEIDMSSPIIPDQQEQGE